MDLENEDKGKDEDKFVTFTVDATLFRTTVNTLKTYPESMLYKMVTSNMPSQKLPDGSYWINRSSKYFDLIMNFYRMGSKVVSMLPEKQSALNAIRLECGFYSIPDITDMIPDWVDSVCDSYHFFDIETGRHTFAYHYETSLLFEGTEYEIFISSRGGTDLEGKCKCSETWSAHKSIYGCLANKSTDTSIVRLNPSEHTMINDDIIKYLKVGGKTIHPSDFKKMVSMLLIKSKEEKEIGNLTREFLISE